MTKQTKTKQTKRELKERKRRRLVVTGALIIFVTFLVKEMIRDYLRDVKESLAAADTLYTLEGDFQMLETYLLKLDEGNVLASVKGKVAPTASPNEHDYSEEVRLSLQMVKQQDANLQANYSRLKDLVEKIPIGQDKLREPFSKITEVMKKSHDLAEQREKDISGKPPNKETLAWAQLNLGYMLLMEATIAALGGEILEVAREEEKILEKAYNRYTVISIFLYALGLGMGVRGTLSGIELPENGA
jgi:hypothetical protein